MPDITEQLMLQNLNKKKTTQNGFFLIFAEINPEIAASTIQYILEQNFEDKPDVINMLINSPGGCLDSTFAIVDVMESSAIPIRTIGLGQISSGGLMIFMAGKAGQRVITPNTSILSHRFSAGSSGKSHELFAITKEYDLTNERMFNHYKKHTKISDEDIHKYLLPPEDVYLSAQEALDLKICDKVAFLK